MCSDEFFLKHALPISHTNPPSTFSSRSPVSVPPLSCKLSFSWGRQTSLPTPYIACVNRGHPNSLIRCPPYQQILKYHLMNLFLQHHLIMVSFLEALSCSRT